MITEYKTKKTAQVAFNREKKKFEKLICPVFKKKCISNKCVAFNGRVYPVRYYGKPDVYKVFNPCCCSPLVTGTIEMEMP